jgi:hypothetical protein
MSSAVVGVDVDGCPHVFPGYAASLGFLLAISDATLSILHDISLCHAGEW